MSITRFSTVASSNGNRLASGTMIEGMSPSQVNDGVRSLMASIRAQHNEAEWIEFGTGNDVTTYTRVNGTTISMPVDVTSVYSVNRRIKIVDGQGTTLYGRVISVSFSSPSSTIVCEFDGGATLGSGNPTSVKHGIIAPTNTSLPSVVPTGTIQLFGGLSVPTGYLFCDGTAISRTTYSDLFSVIATNYGSGDGSSTFTLPNLQAKFPLGRSGAYAIGSTGGAFAQTPSGTNSAPNFTGSSLTPSGSISVSGTVGGTAITQAQLPNVNLNTTKMFKTEQGADNRGSSSGAGGAYETAVIPLGGSGQTHTHSFSGSGSFSGSSVTPSGSVSAPTFTGSSLDTTNPYQVVNYIIKF